MKKGTNFYKNRNLQRFNEIDSEFNDLNKLHYFLENEIDQVANRFRWNEIGEYICKRGAEGADSKIINNLWWLVNNNYSWRELESKDIIVGKIKENIDFLYPIIRTANSEVAYNEEVLFETFFSMYEVWKIENDDENITFFYELIKKGLVILTKHLHFLKSNKSQIFDYTTLTVDQYKYLKYKYSLILNVNEIGSFFTRTKNDYKVFHPLAIFQHTVESIRREYSEFKREIKEFENIIN